MPWQSNKSASIIRRRCELYAPVKVRVRLLLFVLPRAVAIATFSRRRDEKKQSAKTPPLTLR